MFQKLGPRSFLIETENENFYGRNHKFIRRVLSKPQDQRQATQPSAGKVPVQSDHESLSFQFRVPQAPDKDLAIKEIQTNAISKVLFCVML